VAHVGGYTWVGTRRDALGSCAHEQGGTKRIAVSMAYYSRKGKGSPWFLQCKIVFVSHLSSTSGVG